jgi:hypothetical protein
MTIRYKCEECDAALDINDELAGTEGSCPRCHVVFTVPSANSAVAEPVKKKRPAAPGNLTTEDEIGDFLSSDEIPVATGKTLLVDSDDQIPTGADVPDDDNPLGDEPTRQRKKPIEVDAVEDEELEASPKKKPAKSKESGKASRANAPSSASIAKGLMGKGDAVVETAVDDEHGKKKKRRVFGDGSDRPKGEITSLTDVVVYFLKAGWPGLIFTFLVVAGAYYVYTRMEKKLDVPPLAIVTGTLKINGKPVAAGTRVVFVPVESSKNLKLGQAEGYVDKDGKYALQYSAQNMGAVIGKNYVVIYPSDPNQRIPSRYEFASEELKVDVVKGGKPIDLELRADPE